MFILNGMVLFLIKMKMANNKKCWFLSSSERWRNICVAAAEALSAGIPVISTWWEAPKNLLMIQTGILIPKDDSSAMAETISKNAKQHIIDLTDRWLVKMQ